MLLSTFPIEIILRFLDQFLCCLCTLITSDSAIFIPHLLSMPFLKATTRCRAFSSNIHDWMSTSLSQFCTSLRYFNNIININNIVGLGASLPLDFFAQISLLYQEKRIKWLGVYKSRDFNLLPYFHIERVRSGMALTHILNFSLPQYCFYGPWISKITLLLMASSRSCFI